MTKTPLESAMKILAVRPHCEFELLEKLKKKAFSREEILTCIEDCKRYGFLNDALYAEDFANVYAARGCGSLLIRQKLRQKRIKEEFITAALNQLQDEFDQAAVAMDFKIRMLKNEKDPRKKREKIYRFMLSRGYTSDIIRRLMNRSE